MAMDDRGGPAVAYFSMEIALDDAIPTYSGGLGVLAGDHLRAAADAGLPVVGVTLVYHRGYFEQHVDRDGGQHERPVRWDPSAVLERVGEQVTVCIEGRDVQVAAWRSTVTGTGGHRVPVYLLDTRLPANVEGDRALCDELYGGDESTRLGQEIVLGAGGVAMLAALGHDVATYHMNEGHSAILALALLDKMGASAAAASAPSPGAGSGGPSPAAGTGAPSPAAGSGDGWRQLQDRCVFTTHTPVAAGHDRFPEPLVRRMLGGRLTGLLEGRGLLAGGELNMTLLALAAAGRSNAVSRRHGEVTRAMFPGRDIGSITNGVHAPTWVSSPVAAMLDQHVPRWRTDNTALRAVATVPIGEIRAAHADAKRAMVAAVRERTGAALDPEVLTLGVARRATAYKRTALVLSQPEQLRKVVAEVGPLQFVFAGKAHPRDEPGKQLIRTVVTASKGLRGTVTVVFVPGYSMALAKLLCAGVDVWCNTPVRPHEASGTSGMKAALNGVPSLSVLDGWWVEGNVEGVTGWSIGADPDVAGSESGDPADDPTYAQDAASFTDRLATTVAPLYYRDPAGFGEVMRSALALNGSYFTTQRMVREYASIAYGAAGG